MTKDELIELINHTVYENEDGDITGDLINLVLNAIVATIGVEANPDDEATGTLNKIKIGEEVFDVEGGGGTVDPYPTEGSTNPVQSGGVYDALNTLIPRSSLFGGFITDAGTPNPDDSRIYFLTLLYGDLPNFEIYDLPNNGKWKFIHWNPRDAAWDWETIDSYTSAKIDQLLSAVAAAISGKQDTISDLATIRTGAAAGATAYQKPSTGIPKTDLASGVQTSLGKADSAFQKPSGGIPASDLAAAVQTSLGKADTAVQQVTVGTTTTGNAGTNASVTNSGTATAPVLNFTIPRGSDGQDGADAVNPFKGWWPDLATLKAAHTATAGDSAYVKDASPATTWSIYVYDSTASSNNYWADSGTDADTSNVQTFASGEEVNRTGIDNSPIYSSDNLITSKAVFEELYNLEGELSIDPSTLIANPNKLVLTSSGVWIEGIGNTASVSYALLPQSQGLLLKIKRGDNAVGIAYTFLKTNNPSVNAHADYADGYTTQIVNTTDSEVSVVIPADANYLYFTRLFNGAVYEPKEIKYIGIAGGTRKYVLKSELKELIESETPYVDINLDSVIFNSPNDIISHSQSEKWIVGINSQTVMMPCDGCASVRIEKNQSSDIAFSFLKSKEYEIGDTADYATGYTQVVTSDSDVEVNIPSDAKYLYVVYVFGGADYKPTHVYLKGTYALKQEVDNEIFQLRKSIGGSKKTLGNLLDRNFNIISHLGGGSFYGSVAPMNSMWSANIAARMGMRCCEFDIVFTSDDVPICCHDLNISTSGNNEFVKKDGTAITGSTPIGSLTYQQIIDTYEYRQGFVGYKQISTLFDVLKVYRDNNIIPCLEVKNPATSMTSTRYNLILNALHDYAGDDFMIVMFDVDNAIALRNLDENALIGISDQVFNQSMITTAKQYNFFCGLYLNVITSTIIENFKSEGVELYGWTVSTDVNAALKLGLRYFICDYIAEPQTTAGVVDTYVSNALDFSNITHTGTVTDNHLVLASGQTATITSSVTHWLNSIEAHIIIKGTCTISVGSTNFAVINADFEEYIVLLREYNKTSETITINGACEIASIECIFKSY